MKLRSYFSKCFLLLALISSQLHGQATEEVGVSKESANAVSDLDQKQAPEEATEEVIFT